MTTPRAFVSSEGFLLGTLGENWPLISFPCGWGHIQTFLQSLCGIERSPCEVLGCSTKTLNFQQYHLLLFSPIQYRELVLFLNAY